jgi:hypothetical protein
MRECTCSFWLKNYKCSHVIATAFRLNLVSWDPIFLDLPLAKKTIEALEKRQCPLLFANRSKHRVQLRNSLKSLVKTKRSCLLLLYLLQKNAVDDPRMYKQNVRRKTLSFLFYLIYFLTTYIIRLQFFI